MKDPSGLIRTWLYGVLNGAVSYGGSNVPVYSFVPKDAAKPYILLGSQSMSSELDESTKDAWITRNSLTIEIYADGSSNDASYVALNTISDSVLQLIRTRSAATISGFTVVSRVIDNTLTEAFDFDTSITLLKIINITLIMVEV